jgi:hypothetical protein
VDLANSFVEVARDRGIDLSPDVLQSVSAAVAHADSVTGIAQSFAQGLVVGESGDAAGLAGTLLGDLFVFGDIRDAIREGSRYMTGQRFDDLILGLACLGLAITAGTYASLGAAGPARVGVSAIKAARKSGVIGPRLANWSGRTIREVIDWPALQRASLSLATPAVVVRSAREAVKVEKANGLVKLVGDVGRVQTRAGTRAAFDSLKLADGPRDVSRIASLAEKNGGKTRAILKTLGRGAIFLAVSSFDLAWWIFGALFSLLGFAASAKAAVERMTLRHLDRRKRWRLRQALAARA